MTKSFSRRVLSDACHSHLTPIWHQIIALTNVVYTIPLTHFPRLSLKGFLKLGANRLTQSFLSADIGSHKPFTTKLKLKTWKVICCFYLFVDFVMTSWLLCRSTLYLPQHTYMQRHIEYHAPLTSCLRSKSLPRNVVGLYLFGLL